MIDKSCAPINPSPLRSPTLMPGSPHTERMYARSVAPTMPSKSKPLGRTPTTRPRHRRVALQFGEGRSSQRRSCLMFASVKTQRASSWWTRLFIKYSEADAHRNGPIPRRENHRLPRVGITRSPCRKTLTSLRAVPRGAREAGAAQVRRRVADPRRRSRVRERCGSR